MVEKSLEQLKIKNYEIALIPDIHNYPKWVVHVASIISNFDVVISNSSLTRSLFEQQGFKVEETMIYDRKKYSGKEIRHRIISEETWEELVPEPVIKIIKEIDGVKRLKNLAKTTEK
jgi:nicotinamide-nucleotide adenylyltransferase